jgi:GTPase SAR1 family protein
MIKPLDPGPPPSYPLIDHTALRTESDVEQKYLFPFLAHSNFLSLPTKWIRTKEYMAPTELDKRAGKLRGYVPDYSVWFSGLPVLIIEAKAPDVAIELGLREARLYASEINRRYPPKINPIGFALASNGREIALTRWDSEADTLIASISECVPGSDTLTTFRANVGKAQLEIAGSDLAGQLQTRPFVRTAGHMGGQQRLSQQLGVNEFAQDLFPVITKYFGNESEEITSEIIEFAYVSSEEITQYDAVLETYLKDRVNRLGSGAVKPIITGKSTESGLTREIKRFSQDPNLYGRVQLVVGAVGAGKSTFIRRFYSHLMPPELMKKTMWSFIDFNVMPPAGEGLRDWIADRFVKSCAAENNIDIYELSQLEQIFSVELNRFDRGPAKLIKRSDPGEYNRRKSDALQRWIEIPTKFAEAITQHFSGERHIGLVIVFDNVDRRDRDEQLAIFEAAQWLKELTRSLVIVNLRDTTFEAHRDQEPLDAFVNAVNFYVRPPRFAKVIEKRLELVLARLSSEVTDRQEYSLSSGIRIAYPASKLGKFLLTIYLSLFHRKSNQVAASAEALVAKNVRRALGMFADIIVSPHIPTGQITGTILAEGDWRIPEYQIIRALMRGRHRYFGGQSSYIKNILNADPDHLRPSNLLYADILEFLIRNRKNKIDFTVEGYASAQTVVNKMGQLGYDDNDSFAALLKLVAWGLVEPESLVAESIKQQDAVRMHAAGFVHMRFLCKSDEYIVGVTPDTHFSSFAVADDIARIWSGQMSKGDISLSSKRRIAERVAVYFREEYERRLKRHAFYEEFGHGGRFLVQATQEAFERLALLPQRRGL